MTPAPKPAMCSVCGESLKGEIEARNELCWVCIRLRNSACAEKHYHQVEG